MVKSYNELKEFVDNGGELDWKEITFEQLEQLVDVDYQIDTNIASLYKINRDMVRTKRYKWNLRSGVIRYAHDGESDKKKYMQSTVDRFS